MFPGNQTFTFAVIEGSFQSTLIACTGVAGLDLRYSVFPCAELVHSWLHTWPRSC